MASVCSRVVHSARFKYNIFFLPSHWPIYFPLKFNISSTKYVNFAHMPTCALIFYIACLAIIRNNVLSFLFAAVAIYAYWIVVFSFPIASILRSKTIYYIKNFKALIHGKFNFFCISSASIFLCLINAFRFNSHSFKFAQKALFKKLCITLVFRKRARYIYVWHTYIF